MAMLTFKDLTRLLQGNLPRQVILEYTDQCNASCAQCGMRRENRYPRNTLSLEQLKPVFDKMAEQHVKLVHLSGGEPLLYLDEIADCARYARQVGISRIVTGTNGFMFKNHERPDFADKMKRLADTLLDAEIYGFWISLDSASAAIHEKNRGFSGIVAGIAKALPIMHERGLYPNVSFVPNRLMGGTPLPPSSAFEPTQFYAACRDSLRRYFTHVQQLGFTALNTSYPIEGESGSNEVVYLMSSTENMIHFSRAEKAILYRALFDTILEFRHQLRIFTPLVMLRSLIRHYEDRADDAYACRGGIDIFFINAQQMDTYPCGFRGQENLGKFEALDFAKLDTQANCKACDLQCFRDPSEVLGPVIDLARRPWHLAKRCWRDKEYARLWLDGIRYYHACDYFDGRAAPNPKALARFKTIPAFEI